MSEDTGTGLAVVDPRTGELAAMEMSVNDVMAQVQKIQHVMKAVMKSGEHYGTIPGCGDKPTLLKAGAEKIGFTFRLVPRFVVERIDYPNGHREYNVTCELVHAQTGAFVGSGLGCCSTMEAKYRFRSEVSDRPVPREYWDTRDSSLLGGPQYHPRKVSGQWFIAERVEHDNPADYYNTILKMAKKRAHIDAILTATAASDIFTQDLEDLKANGVISDQPEQQQSQQQAQRPRQQGNGGRAASQPQRAGGNGNGGNGRKDLPDDQARAELLRICQEIAQANLTVASQDYVNFDLVEASDSLSMDDLIAQICVALSSWNNGRKIIQGKTADQLSGPSLQITLKKANGVHSKLQQETTGEPTVAEGA